MNAPTAVLAQLPKYNAIRQTVQRARNEAQQAPPNPQSRDQLIIPDAYASFEGQNFLLVDTGVGDAERILVFGKQDYSVWAHQVTRLYVDGTFKASIFISNLVILILGLTAAFLSTVSNSCWAWKLCFSNLLCAFAQQVSADVYSTVSIDCWIAPEYDTNCYLRGFWNCYLECCTNCLAWRFYWWLSVSPSSSVCSKNFQRR